MRPPLSRLQSVAGLIGHLAGWVGLSAALITIPVMISVAGAVIGCTRAFDAADEFHRDVMT